MRRLTHLALAVAIGLLAGCVEKGDTNLTAGSEGPHDRGAAGNDHLPADGTSGASAPQRDATPAEVPDAAPDQVRDAGGSPPDPCAGGCPERWDCVDSRCKDPTAEICEWSVPGPERDVPMCEIWQESQRYTIGCFQSADCPEESSPEVNVVLRDFLLDRDEVSNRRYREYLQETPGSAPRCEEDGRPELWSGEDIDPKLLDRPVACVTAEQAEAFCQWANKRLPTAASWEAAARSGGRDRYPWGPEFDSADRAQCLRTVWDGPPPEGECSNDYGVDRICGDDAPITACRETAPVTLPDASAPTRPEGKSRFGPHHLAGNVAEWVADAWVDRHSCPAEGCFEDPATRPGPGAEREVRGGSFNDAPNQIAGWSRLEVPHEWKSRAIGFRCAADLGERGAE